MVAACEVTQTCVSWVCSSVSWAALAPAWQILHGRRRHRLLALRLPSCLGGSGAFSTSSRAIASERTTLLRIVRIGKETLKGSHQPISLRAAMPGRGEQQLLARPLFLPFCGRTRSLRHEMGNGRCTEDPASSCVSAGKSRLGQHS